MVWDEERQKTLIDSIKQSYPIGSILLYEARFEQNKVIYEIVDGLQRSKSLLDYNHRRLQFYAVERLISWTVAVAPTEQSMASHLYGIKPLRV